jgi:hypothetical protein
MLEVAGLMVPKADLPRNQNASYQGQVSQIPHEGVRDMSGGNHRRVTVPHSQLLSHLPRAMHRQLDHQQQHVP